MIRPLALLLAAVGIASAVESVDPRLQAVFARAGRERLAVVGIGDSNQRFGGQGWSHHLARHLGRRFGCWSTGLRWEAAAPDAPRPPEELGQGLYAAWWLPEGAESPVDWRHGTWSVPADHPLGFGGRLRMTVRLGAPAGGQGRCRPTVRIDQAPWTELAARSVAVAGDGTLAEASLDLPADPGRAGPLRFALAGAAKGSPDGVVAGPLLVADWTVEDADRRTGIAYSTLYGVGGQSLRDMLGTIRDEWGGRTIDFLRRVRRGLEADGTCVVIIHSGLNDRNELLVSAGPVGGFPGASREAYRDNLLGLFAALERAWAAAGGAPGRLHLVAMPSHPVSTPDDPRLVAYREEAVACAAARPDASWILLPDLVPQARMAEQRWYDGGRATDSHLSQAGYDALAGAVAAALAGAAP